MKFAAWTRNKEDLEEASSGGIFYELAEQFVNDGGVVCGVIMEGMKPEFIMTSNLEDIKKMRGSKYLCANPMPIYTTIAFDTELKDCRHKILFVGLPCQVAGLKRYIKIKELSDENITYVSLRCHGLIKTKIFKDYIKWIESVTKKSVTAVKFRDKANGWKGAGFGFTLDNTPTSFEGDAFKPIFFKPKLIKDYIKQLNVTKRCKTCTYDRNASDITLGDYWGAHPALKNRYGTSIMETNTAKGYRLFVAIAHNLHWKLIPDNMANIPVSPEKIGLMKVESFRNFGNLMLSSNFITYMKAINKDAKFVFIENESAQDAVEESTGVTDIEYRHIETLNRQNVKKMLLDTFIGLVNPQKMEQVKVFADCKNIVVLGGDHFSGGTHYINWIINLIQLNALARCGKKVSIVSGTLGKFPWFLKPFVKHVFNNLQALYCRDTDSIDRCHAVGIKGNLWYAPDLAFLPLHNTLTNNIEEIKDKYCTIVTTSLWKRYVNTYDEYISGVKRIARMLHMLTKKKVMILPHSTYESDLQIARDVADNKDIFATIGTEPMTPSKAREILTNSYLNVSFRMHGAISSLASGVPVVAIAYSAKYKGVISDGYGLLELVVSKMKRRNWNKCIAETIRKIDYAIGNKFYLSLKIKKVNMQQAKNALNPLLNIGDIK